MVRIGLSPLNDRYTRVGLESNRRAISGISDTPCRNATNSCTVAS